MLLLFVSNDFERVNMRDLLSKYKGESLVKIFEKEKPSGMLVDILSYCLMPNHFHMVIRQKSENGITIFLRRALTAYCMYFNTKYEHSGTLFQGPFKSLHVNDESYFRYIFSYVHLNPVSLIEPGWEEKGIENADSVRRFMAKFPYSSYYDYSGLDRPERAILATEDIPEFLTTQNDLEDLLRFAKDSPL